MKCFDFASNATDRIKLYRKQVANDSYGGQTESWILASTAWAVVTPTNGREQFAQEQPQSRVTHKILIRRNSALDSTKAAGTYKIEFDDRVFPVKYVRNLDVDLKRHGKAFQELHCEENFPT